MSQHQVEVIEKGDIFFFYRPKIDTENVRGREDVQRLFMALAPEEPHRHYRLFVIGRKKMPERGGRRGGAHRNWALNVRTSDKPEDIRDELLGKAYRTETRGKRVEPAARPAGEGKYQLFRHRGHTELAYALELPRKIGPVQEDFEIQEEASYVVAVKNPEVSVPGFPAPDEPPAYTREVAAKFGHRRWIDADDPALIDQEHAQLLLIGAHTGAVEEELGIKIETEEETRATSEIYRDLKLRYEGQAARPLFAGEFPEAEKSGPGEEAERMIPSTSRAKARKPSTQHRHPTQHKPSTQHKH